MRAILLDAAALALAAYALFFLYGTFREVRRYVRIVRRLREARVRHMVEWGIYPAGERPRIMGGSQ